MDTKRYKLSGAVICEISLTLYALWPRWWVGIALPGCQQKSLGWKREARNVVLGLFPDWEGLGQGGCESGTEGTWGMSWMGVHVSLKETSSTKPPWSYLELGKRVWKQLDSFPHNPVIFGASSIIWPHKASVLGPNQGEDSLLRSCFPLHGQIKSLLGLAEVPLAPCSNYCSISEWRGFNFTRVRTNRAFCIYSALINTVRELRGPSKPCDLT